MKTTVVARQSENMFSNRTRLVCSRSVYLYRRFALFLSFTLFTFRFPFCRFDFNNVKNTVKNTCSIRPSLLQKRTLKTPPPPLGRMKKKNRNPFYPVWTKDLKANLRFEKAREFISWDLSKREEYFTFRERNNEKERKNGNLTVRQTWRIVQREVARSRGGR